MSERVELVWYGDDATGYDHGPEHPLRPERVTLTRRLIHDYHLLDGGLIAGERVRETPARDATLDELGLVHTERYLDAVIRAGRGERGSWGSSASGPATTLSSPTCTRPRPGWRGRPSPRPRRC